MMKRNEFSTKQVNNTVEKKKPRIRYRFSPPVTAIHFSHSPGNYAEFIMLALAILFTFGRLNAQTSNVERSILKKASFTVSGHSYIPLQDLADILKTHTYYSSKVKKAVLYVDEERLTVSAYTPFVVTSGRIYQMPVDTKYADGDLLLPVKFFLPILKDVVTKSTNGASDLLPASTQPEPSVSIVAAVVEEKANGTLIRVSTLRPFDPSNVSTRYSRNWLYLDILGGRVDEAGFQARLTPGLVKKVVPVQQPQMAQISFQLSKDIASKEIHITNTTNEILISIPSGEDLSRDTIEKLRSDREKWKIDTIIIDPGHGGKDPGAIGSGGLYEKDVVLGIGKKLRDLIVRNLDAKVYMTRDSDTFISLKERTKLANAKQGKLFISIHANWNPSSKVRGTSTYFLGLAKSDEALEISSRENSAIRYEDDGHSYADLTDENIILATMAQNAYNKESQDFASILQQALRKETGLIDRGVKQAGFYVLVGASMPNVLIETAFISNREEERLLRKTSFQQEMAEGIFESVRQFKERYEAEF